MPGSRCRTIAARQPTSIAHNGARFTWMHAHQKNLATVDTATIANFVGELPIRKTQRMRYLRLIERVLDHIRRTEYASTNPARFIAQDGEASWRKARDNEPTGFLTPAERATLLVPVLADRRIRFRVLERAARPRTRCRSFSVPASKPAKHVRLRLVASIRVERHCGSSRRIRISHAKPTWHRSRSRCWKPGSPSASARRFRGTRVPGIPCRAADAQGDDAARDRRDRRIRRASRRRAPRARFPQTLRNTYAAELFEHDVPPERVGKWLASCGRSRRTACIVHGRTGVTVWPTATVTRPIATKLTDHELAAHAKRSVSSLVRRSLTVSPLPKNSPQAPDRLTCAVRPVRASRARIARPLRIGTAMRPKHARTRGRPLRNLLR